MGVFEYYSRKDILRELAYIAKDREIQVWFGKIPGPRPEVINFEGDMASFIRRGMTSLHISEERWKDPLKLKSGMSKKELDSLRKGWDLILDIDCKNLEFSRAATELLIDALKFHNVKDISVKFSGGSGFHIGVPFESFPEKINNVDVKDLFPDGPRMVASYLKEIIRDALSSKFMLLAKDFNNLSKKFSKEKKDLVKDGIFDPYSVLEIDAVLISSRHMIRAPYSINEKTGLVSVPINLDEVSNFNLKKARPENVEVNVRFLDRENVNSSSAKYLILQAFDFYEKKKEVPVKKKKEFEVPDKAVDFKKFPPCILNCLKGVKEDGRKRSVFVLINFLRHMGYNFENIKKMLLEWNEKNYEKLREGYILSQIKWFENQNKLILPPNCNNEVYYKGAGICKPDNICKSIKNPINYFKKKKK